MAQVGPANQGSTGSPSDLGRAGPSVDGTLTGPELCQTVLDRFTFFLTILRWFNRSSCCAGSVHGLSQGVVGHLPDS